MKNTVPSLVLVSGSPRRLEILRAHGVDPEIILPHIDEEELMASWENELPPALLAQRLALSKARAVYEQIKASPANDSALPARILAADTLVYKEGLGVLGKPAHHDAAVAMLVALKNTEHTVITGMAGIERSTGREAGLADETTVRFGDYTLREIESYIAAEPPFDKAGSYAIQGLWKVHVTSVDGDLENVIGLPFYRLEELFEE